MNNLYIREEAKNAFNKFINRGKTLGILINNREELKKFSDVQKKFLAYNNSSLGLQNILLSNIVGSVQKTEDFRKGFIPKNSIVKIRWCNIYMEMLGNYKLPPVELYKIRDEYFVYDGNHRISVANFLNFSSIEAIVTEFFSSDDNPQNLNYKEKFEFIKQTELNIDLTVSEDYKKLLYDIKSLDSDDTRDNLIKKSKYWYQNIYIPIVGILQFNDVTVDNKIDGDSYIKFLEHKNYLINHAKKYDYSYALIDYLTMIHLKKKYTICTQIKINHYILTLIKRLYRLDKKRSMEQIQKNKFIELKKLINGDFIDEFYFSKIIRKDIRVWYHTNFRVVIDIFKDKSKSFDKSKLIQKNQLKLYRELKDYINYHKKNFPTASSRECILDYIIEILIPIFKYLSRKKIDDNEFIIRYFKFSHRKVKFLKNGKNIELEELENLYHDIGSTTSTIQEWLSKTLKKEKKFKGDILKSVTELLFIKAQDVEAFTELMELYEGTTNYKTVNRIKKQIWNFIELYPCNDWVKEKFSTDLDELIQSKEGLKTFKTERFIKFIREESNIYTIVDFYMDLINYKIKNKIEGKIDVDTLLIQYLRG